MQRCADLFFEGMQRDSWRGCVTSPRFALLAAKAGAPHPQLTPSPSFSAPIRSEPPMQPSTTVIATRFGHWRSLAARNDIKCGRRVQI